MYIALIYLKLDRFDTSNFDSYNFSLKVRLVPFVVLILSFRKVAIYLSCRSTRARSTAPHEKYSLEPTL